jgi:DNA-binding MarR family transcriptional regulator
VAPLPRADLVARISLAGAAIERHVSDTLAAEGWPRVGSGHGYVIQRLLTGPQQVTAMAGDLGITQQAVSKTVKELVAAGLARQTIDAQDSRRRPVELTERGHAVVSRSREIRADLQREMGARNGARDLAAAGRVLDGVLDRLGLTERIANRTVPAPAR